MTFSGRADFVADIGDEGALQPRRSYRGVARPLQLGLVGFLRGDVALLNHDPIGIAGQDLAGGAEHAHLATPGAQPKGKVDHRARVNKGPGDRFCDFRKVVG